MAILPATHDCTAEGLSLGVPAQVGWDLVKRNLCSDCHYQRLGLDSHWAVVRRRMPVAERFLGRCLSSTLLVMESRVSRYSR
jgi:hypothetical protein